MNRMLSTLVLVFVMALPATLSGQDTQASPPREVKAILALIDVLDIDDATQSVTMDLVVRMTWTDSTWTRGRQSFDEADLSKIWYPELQVVNGQGMGSQIRKGIVEVFADGTHIFRQRYFGKLSAATHSQDFPFDKHQFSVQCIAINPEPIDFVIDPRVGELASEYSVLDWQIEGEAFAINSHNVVGKDFPGFQRTFEGRRFVAYYFWKIFVPLTLVVIMSWTVFWVDPKHMEQLTVAVTAMLTIIALQFTLQDLTPDISYLTRMDVYLLSCNILVLLALLESVFTSNLLSSGHRERALRLDRISRWAFPLAYLLCCALAVVW